MFGKNGSTIACEVLSLAAPLPEPVTSTSHPSISIDQSVSGRMNCAFDVEFVLEVVPLVSLLVPASASEDDATSDEDVEEEGANAPLIETVKATLK